MTGRSHIIALLLALLAAPLAAAEGGGTAKEGTPPPGQEEKVWTNEDLRELKGKGVSVLGGGASAPPAPATAQRGEHWWRTQYTLMTQRLKQYEASLASQKQLLARASNPYTRAMARTETGQIADVTQTRERIAELEKGIETTRKAVTDLDTAARKSGVPRDWREPYKEGAMRRADPHAPASKEP
jgi:hypothetical protein